MRKQTQDDIKYINMEKDMLEGNINRMCTTKSLEEFYQMAYWAFKRINTITTINYARLTEGEETRPSKRKITFIGGGSIEFEEDSEESADERLLNSDWGEMEVRE